MVSLLATASHLKLHQKTWIESHKKIYVIHMFPPNLYMFHGEISQKARVLAQKHPISSTSFGKKNPQKHPNKVPSGGRVFRASRPSRVSRSRPWPSPRGAGPGQDRWSDPLGGVTDAVASARPWRNSENPHGKWWVSHQPNGGLSSCLGKWNNNSLTWIVRPFGDDSPY